MIEISITAGFIIFIAAYLYIAHKFHDAKKRDKIARQKLYEVEKYIKEENECKQKK